MNYFFFISGFEAWTPPPLTAALDGETASEYGSFTYLSPVTLGFSVLESSIALILLTDPEGLKLD